MIIISPNFALGSQSESAFILFSMKTKEFEEINVEKGWSAIINDEILFGNESKKNFEKLIC